MKNLKKKGFTIVELVIVIAVIAILAAVLIPTFVNLTKKANMSADQQAVRHMNTLLAMDETKPTNTDEVVEILIENGYKDDLTTYYDGYTLAWLATENKIVLVENNVVVWPKDYEGETVYTELKPMVKDVEELLGSLTDGKVVFVSEDITTEGLSPEEAGEYVVNLNGNKLNSSDYVGSWVEGAKLTISNGIIYSENEKIGAYVADNGVVELNNVQIYSASGANPLQCYGGTMVLNNVTATQSGNAETAWYNSSIQVVNRISQDEDGKYYFTGKQAHLTVNGGMYSGDKAIQVSAPGGTVIINDGTFIGVTAAINFDFNQTYANQGALYSITINGGNFTGAIKINNSNITCIVNGGTFSVNIGEVANVTIGEGKVVVDNGNGTWSVK